MQNAALKKTAFFLRNESYIQNKVIYWDAEKIKIV